MPVIYLRHERHGTKVACSWHEARDDMEWGWEEYNPNDPEGMETPVSSEVGTPENSGNALRATKRRRKE